MMLAIVYSIGHFFLEIEAVGKRVGKGEEFTPPPIPTPYFLPSTSPLVQISFSPQAFAIIKLKDGGHNFR